MKLRVEKMRSLATLPRTPHMAISANLMNSSKRFNMSVFCPMQIYTFVNGFWSMGSSIATFAWDFMVSLNSDIYNVKEPPVYEGIHLLLLGLLIISTINLAHNIKL